MSHPSQIIRSAPVEKACAWGCGLLGFLIVVWLTPFGSATTPDSLLYLDTARHLSTFQGFSVSDISLHSEAIAKPLTTWPPLYPLTLAPLVFSGIPPVTAARWISAILFAATGLIFFRLARPAAHSPSLALPGCLAGLASLILLLQPILLTVYTHAWSETLFIPLSLLAFGAWEKFIRRCDQISNPNVFDIALPCASALLALACWTRFIGVSFALAAAIPLLLRRRFIQLATLLALPILSLIALLIRNLSTAQRFIEIEQAGYEGSLIGNLTATGGVIWTFFLAPHPMIALGLAGLVALAWTTSPIRRLPPPIRRSILQPLLWGGAYLVILVALRTWHPFDPIDVRLISPAIPFLLLALWRFFLLLPSHPLSTLKRQAALAAAAFWLIGSLIAGIALIQRVHLSWIVRHTPDLPSSPRATYTNFTAPINSASFAELKSELTRLDRSPILLFENPRLLRLHTSLPVKELPAHPLTPAEITTINRIGPCGFILLASKQAVHNLSMTYGGRLDRLQVIPLRQSPDLLVVRLPLPVK
ncbi:MAG: hypothetical protein PHV34_01395 [Verrucomicrobiae bacterium]|nr:hypothetical protein [Verrucomicrobiae bacterium]